MPKLTYTCPICSKQLKLKEELELGGEKLFSYTCGHSFARDITHLSKDSIDFNAVDGSGKAARHYQEDGIQFILESDFNCIVADQMRLGKTPQALLALKHAYKDRTPALILVKGANLWQWCREYKVWCDSLPNGIFPIIGSKAWIPPGFSAYIISMDTFAKPTIQEALRKIHFKLIIADEAHSYKNTDSNRSQALVEFMAFQNTGELPQSIKFTCPKCSTEWEEKSIQKIDKRIGLKTVYKHSKCPKCSWYQSITAGSSEQDKDDPELKPCGIVLLTGTPILNRASEYFVPLNLVNPEKFSSFERFKNNWLDPTGQRPYSRVKDWKLGDFKREIASFLIRREKEDVYKELPKLNKLYTLIDPDKTLLAKKYNQVLDQLELKLASKAKLTFFDSLAEMTELRRLCGLMKVCWSQDYLEDCRNETEAKYAIGIHHESVRDTLYLALGGADHCFKLSGEDNSDRKDWIMRNWAESNKQFLIINMLAGGVGMDFHYCDNVLVLERQWNGEIESQFEFRFYNPDLSIKKNPTNVEYIICRGTLDEWFYDLIESKKQAVGETVYNNFDLETDVDSFRNLVERTVSNRL